MKNKIILFITLVLVVISLRNVSGSLLYSQPNANSYSNYNWNNAGDNYAWSFRTTTATNNEFVKNITFFVNNVITPPPSAIWSYTVPTSYSNFNYNDANDNFAWNFTAGDAGIPTNITINIAAIVGTPTGIVRITRSNQTTGGRATTNYIANSSKKTITTGNNTWIFENASTLTAGTEYFVFFSSTSSSGGGTNDYPGLAANYNATEYKNYVYRSTGSNQQPPLTFWSSRTMAFAIGSDVLQLGVTGLVRIALDSGSHTPTNNYIANSSVQDINSGWNNFVLQNSTTSLLNNTLYWVFFSRTSNLSYYPEISFNSTNTSFKVYRSNASNIEPPNVLYDNVSIKMNITSSSYTSTSQTPTYTPNGKVNGAYSFNGVNNILNVTDINITQMITTTLWSRDGRSNEVYNYSINTSTSNMNFNGANDNYAWGFNVNQTITGASITIFFPGVTGSPTGIVRVARNNVSGNPPTGNQPTNNYIANSTSQSILAGLNTWVLQNTTSFIPGELYWVIFTRTSSAANYPTLTYTLGGVATSGSQVWRTNAINVEPPNITWFVGAVTFSVSGSTAEWIYMVNRNGSNYTNLALNNSIIGPYRNQEGNLIIGQYNNNSYFNGTIDEFQSYNYYVSDEQLALNYQNNLLGRPNYELSTKEITDDANYTSIVNFSGYISSLLNYNLPFQTTMNYLMMDFFPLPEALVEINVTNSLGTPIPYTIYFISNGTNHTFNGPNSGPTGFFNVDLETYNIIINATYGLNSCTYNNYLINQEIPYYLTPCTINTTLFEVHAKDNYDNTTITNFSIKTNGVSQSTDNGVIYTALDSYNCTASQYNVSLTQANNTFGEYFTQNYTNYNCTSLNLTIYPYQVEAKFNATMLYTNTLVTGNFSVPLQTSNEILYLKAGLYNVTFYNSTLVNKVQEFTFSALQNVSRTVENVTDSFINITLLDINNNNTISGFSGYYYITLAGINTNTTYTTTTNYSTIATKQGLNYTVFLNSANYSLTAENTKTINTDYSYNNLTFSLFPANTVIFNIYNLTNLVRLNGTNVNINLVSLTQQYNYSTNTGYYNAYGLVPETYTVTVSAIGNFSDSTYQITVGSQSYQVLNVYLQYGNIIYIYTKTPHLDNLQTNIIIQQLVGTTYVPITNQYTDITGFARVFVTDGQQYRMVLSSGGYTTKEFLYTFYLANSPYTFILDPATSSPYITYNNHVSYYVTPNSNNASLTNTTTNFQLTTTSNDGSLQRFFINDPQTNTTVISYTPSGTTINMTVPLNNRSGTYKINYGFLLSNYTEVNWSIYYHIQNTPYYNNTIASSAEDLKQQISSGRDGSTWLGIVAMFIILMAVVIAFQLTGSSVISVALSIFGVIGFAILGWISPIIAVFVGVISLGWLFIEGGI